MNPSVVISIEEKSWRGLKRLAGSTRAAIAEAAREAGVQIPQKSEVSILLSNDARIRELNKSWRGIDKPTNVLSFPATERVPGLLLGDIVIAYETVRREAEADGKSLPGHYLHMVVHGFLHLLGFDHARRREADLMENLETKILESLGVNDPYKTRIGSGKK